MAKLRLYNQITDKEDKLFLQDWGLDGTCYQDIQSFLESTKEDPEVNISIHCPGGNCTEGWAIYDALRNSGRDITATIEGECSSMATIILLAAPLERRFGYENARMCIHNPAVSDIDTGGINFWRLTADEIAKLKDRLTAQEMSLIEEQKRILDLYVKRTGAKRKELQALMDEDKYVDMAKAKELGFITSTLKPNTASKSRHFRTQDVETAVFSNSTLKDLLIKAGLVKVGKTQSLISDQKLTAADGSVFTVEREDGDPQVGDTAYPDGTYVMEDGTTIVVEDEVIVSVTKEDEDGGNEGKCGEEPQDSASPEDGQERLEKLISDLEGRVESLTSQLEALTKANGDLAKANEELGRANDDLTEANEELGRANDVLTAEKEALTQTNAALQESNTRLSADNVALIEEKDSLVTKNAGLQSQADALQAAQKTAGELSVLETVNRAGGKAWLDAVCKLYSSFRADTPQFAAQGDNPQGQLQETKSERMLREKKEQQAALRAARNR